MIGPLFWPEEIEPDPKQKAERRRTDGHDDRTAQEEISEVLPIGLLAIMAEQDKQFHDAHQGHDHHTRTDHHDNKHGTREFGRCPKRKNQSEQRNSSHHLPEFHGFLWEFLTTWVLKNWAFLISFLIGPY
ncbi:MAG: hypothetical protein DWI24_06895 [Planctomycetota bacterium]|nr:MAG: hypothetical protein DWI24_06895 [Planctomycetota bacterium]